MKKITPKSLGFLLMFTYMVSYITRVNYSAVIVEMVNSTGFLKSQLSVAVTVSFFTYGIGQIISGWLGDRIQPKILIFSGIAISVSMNLVITLCGSPLSMAIVWGINGFAQALMWPPIVRLMTSLLNAEEYSRASLIVSWGSSIGTILVYLFAPIMIFLAGYKAMFVFSAVCGIIMIPIWLKNCPEVPAVVPKKEEKIGNPSSSLTKTLLTPIMISVMLAIVFQGALRDGISTWMPSYINETYNLGSSISILTGIILPIFSIGCLQLSGVIHSRLLKNPLVCSGVIFGVGALSAVGLYYFTGTSTVGSIGCMALLSGCMHGVNFILICIIPSYFKNSGHISLISGVLNACTYLGSAISIYGIALLTENTSWKITTAVWFAISAAGCIVCCALANSWKRRYEKI